MSETITTTTELDSVVEGIVDDEQTTEPPEVEPVAPVDADRPGDQDDADDDTEADDETFSRSYVEKLRTENGRYRQRAAQADTLAARLHTELVRATGRLADPADLPFDAEHLDDPEVLTAALDELLDAKPHLATRRPAGDIGQGQRGSASSSFSLLEALKSRT